jgi:AcrR family transcriptional regulator
VPMTTARRTHAERQLDAEDRLTQALAELIAAQGYERTTAAQIGERAGYSRAAVRDRYGSKDGLLLAMHARYEQLLLGDPGDPPATIAELLARIERFTTDHPEWLRAIFVVSFEAVGASAAFAPVVRRWTEQLDRLAIDLLTRERDAGSLRANLDPESVGPILIDQAIGGSYRWALSVPGTPYSEFFGDRIAQTLRSMQP